VTVASRAEPKPPVGVIESLSTGFEITASHIGLILFPLVLDLFLWFGPHLSIFPLTERLIKFISDQPAPDEANAQLLQMMIERLKVEAEQNFFNRLSTVPLGIPVLMGNEALGANPIGYPLVWPISSVLGLLTLVLGLSIVGLLLGTIYFVLIGAAFADGERPTWGEISRRMLVNWARLTTLSLIVFVFSLGVGVLLFLFIAILLVTLAVITQFAPFSLNVGLIVVAISEVIAASLVLWLILLLAFSVHGMVLKNRGVLGSMWDSVRLVQWNLLPAMSLFTLIYLINAGLSYLFNLPASDSWLRLAGIGGHAFVATGLVAATFVFYKDRYRWWTEMRQWLMVRKNGKQR
jgi:hypothetical protein